MRGAYICIVKCRKCGQNYYPYGEVPFIPPAYDTVVCPNCGDRTEGYVWDLELQRETYRKKIGTDKNLEEKMKKIEEENKEIKEKIGMLEGQVKELKSSIERLIPEIRQQVAVALANTLNEPKKSIIKPI